MIDHAKFKEIKAKYGHYASWAVWADVGEKPKDNIGDLTIFENVEKDGLLTQLKPEVVLVGLNISRGAVPFPLGNFHDGRPQSQDYKIRYALKGTSLWGAYITDIIKDFDEKASGKVMAYLRHDSGFERDNVNIFRQELIDLGARQPKIIAFGGNVFKVLARNFGGQYEVLRIPHYSKYISQEDYREEVGTKIKSMESA